MFKEHLIKERMKRDIITLTQRIEDLNHELMDLQQELKQRRMDLFKLEFGLRVGGLVKAPDGEVLKVKYLGNIGGHKPWVYGSRKNKNGTYSQRLERLLRDDWTVVKEESNEPTQ
jgi:hypothetical protein